MLPPVLIRRLVLAPLVIVIACGFIVLAPFLALLALVFGLLARSRAGRMRSLRLIGFVLVWFVAETVALVVLAGLWVVSGFGGRMRTEPYQSRHYAVMRRLLDTLYEGAEKTYGLRVEVDEPDLTGDELAARLTKPVIVLSRHAGPGDSLLLVHQLLSVYHRRPRVVMKAALQLDPSVDIVGNRLPNVWIKDRKSTRLNSSHTVISYAVFCLKKKTSQEAVQNQNEPQLRDENAHNDKSVHGVLNPTYQAGLRRDAVQPDIEAERKKRDEIEAGKSYCSRRFGGATCDDKSAQIYARFDKIFFFILPPPPKSTLFPYTTLFR